MSLRVTVAAPFLGRGADRLAESEFVVALSLDRDWFSPDQAKDVAARALERDLLERDGDDLTPTFDVAGVTIPEGYVPDESVLADRSVFERIVATLEAADVPKQDAVAAINERQQRLAITLEAAAVIYARSEGVDVSGPAADARAALDED